MKPILWGLFAVLCFSSLCFAQPLRLPHFEDYSISPVFSGNPASVRLTSQKAREFRTTIREQAQKGSNFAGHYTLVTWGCGAACAELAVVDEKSGQIYFPKNVSGVKQTLDDVEDPLQFRTSSNLLVVTGNVAGLGHGQYYFVWSHHRFVLVRSVHRKP